MRMIDNASKFTVLPEIQLQSLLYCFTLVINHVTIYREEVCKM